MGRGEGSTDMKRAYICEKPVCDRVPFDCDAWGGAVRSLLQGSQRVRGAMESLPIDGVPEGGGDGKGRFQSWGWHAQGGRGQRPGGS